MAIQINNKGVNHAKSLIRAGKVDMDSSWSFDADDENKILGEPPDWAEYSKWFIAIDTDADPETKGHYKFPYGKNGKVYRRGVIAAKARASQMGYDNIKRVADELLQMIDEEYGEEEERMQIEQMHRSVEIKEFDALDRSITVIFSTEQPILRWFGYEILDHGESAVRLERLNKGGAVLLNHDIDKQIGVIETAYIKDRKGIAEIRFSRNALAEEVLQDIKDGIRRFVSVGYQINEMKLEKDEEIKTYRVIDWEPLEISIVAVPADLGASIIRDKRVNNVRVFNPYKLLKKEVKTKMEDIRVIANEIREKELERIRTLQKLGEQHGCMEMAKKFIDEGKSVEEFREAILTEVYEAKRVDNRIKVEIPVEERKNYSFVRLINAMIESKFSGRSLKELAPFEIEVSEYIANTANKAPRGVFIPQEMFTRQTIKKETTGSYGAYLIDTELRGEDLVEALLPKTVVVSLGATQLTGLVGDVAIPREDATVTTYWVADAVSTTGSNPVMGQLTLTPKTVGGYTDISRKMLKQASISVEDFIKRAFTRNIAVAIDTVAINGSGTNQPTGILNTTGLSIVESGTNGGAPTWDLIVALETNVANENADVGALAYLTNSKVRGKLKRTPKVTGYPDFIWEKDNTINGYRAEVSNIVPSNFTKGTGTNLSAIIFGNWEDLIIAQWSGIDMLVDPYTGGAAGTVRVILLQDVDIGIRRIKSFAAIKDAITT